MHVTRGMEGGHPKCVQVRTERERGITPHVYIRSFKKGVFVRNGYFSPMRSISVVMK